MDGQTDGQGQMDGQRDRDKWMDRGQKQIDGLKTGWTDRQRQMDGQTWTKTTLGPQKSGSVCL